MLGAMISVGRWTASIVQAMVALLPLPVMPSRVWKRSPRTTPSDSWAMAVGWSPAGAKSETTLNSGMRSMVPGACDIIPDATSWPRAAALAGARPRPGRSRLRGRAGRRCCQRRGRRAGVRSSRSIWDATRAQASSSVKPRCSTRRATATSSGRVHHDARRGRNGRGGDVEQGDVEHHDPVGRPQRVRPARP